jgi:hypothetical protein
MSTPQRTPELAAVEVHGVTRSHFLLRGALAAGAVYGASAVAPFVGNALAAAPDVDILNFALTLEYLESDFYQSKGKSVHLSGEAKTLAASFGDEEAQHVAALTKAITSLGGKPVKKPMFAFPVTNQASFLKLAYTLENTGVGGRQRRRPHADQQEPAGGRRIDRPGGGAPRRVHRPAHRHGDHARRRVRQAADQVSGPGQGGAADQVARRPTMCLRGPREPPPSRVARAPR